MAAKPPMHTTPANMRPDAMGISPQNAQNPKDLLPTFIYDYFIKEKEYNLAQALLKSGLGVQTSKVNPKDVNGVDDDAKDEMQKRLDALPRPALNEQLPESAFLRDWWSLFWDLWSASRHRATNATAMSYIQQSIANARQQSQNRQNMIQGMMPGPNMNAGGMRLNPGQMRNGPMDMRQAAMANSSRPGMRPPMNPQQAAAQGQMQRDGSDMDLNGQRPQSPMSGGGGDNNEPSPKRPRTDGGPQMPGRQSIPMTGPIPNGMPPSTAAMMQGGFDASMNGQFPGGPGGKQMPLYSMGKPGLPGHGPQGSPMIGPNGEMPASGDVASFQQQQQQPQRPGMQGNSHQGGALADYQMQLMLLEQQNKKRLLMARQEQDHLSHNGAPGSTQAPGGGPGGAGGNGGAAGGAMMAAGPGGMMTAPGMSPHGSRTGHSPNNDQMKRGTPKMGQSSPLPDGSMPNRGSPAPGFEGAMPHNMAGNPMFMGNKMADGQMGPGGAMMRPPNGMQFMGPNGVPMNQAQLDMLSRGRLPNGAWPGGPQMQAGQMMQQGGPQMPQGPQVEGAQRSQMPPPSAPAGGNNNNNNNNNNNGRAQPSPPSQTGNAGAPPTPSQASKPAPKKKDTKDSKKKGAQKKASANTGATPNSSAADQPEPTPSTPTIPVHPNSFTGPKAQSGPSSNAQSQAPAGQQVPGAGNGPDASAAGAQPFGALEQGNDMGMGMGMGAFESGDNDGVLEGFDFDSFLHMEETISFPDFDTSQLNFPADGVEMGAAEP